jgi:hypothetical protein
MTGWRRTGATDVVDVSGCSIVIEGSGVEVPSIYDKYVA